MSGATAVSIGTAVAGAAASAILTQVLAPKPKTPTVAAPTKMPGDQERDAAKRNSLLEQQQRKGRASTILTDSASDALGG